MTQPSPRHDPLAVLRLPTYRPFAIGRLLSATAVMLFTSTVFWQVFKISDSEAQLAVVGLVQFVPAVGLTLVGGVAADRYDKRMLAVASQSITLVAFAALSALTAAGDVSLPVIYLTAFLMAAANTFEAPARGAILPALVPRDLFPNAITVNSTFQQLGFVSGPVLSGLLIWQGGPELAYGVAAAFMAISIGLWLMLRLLPVELPKRAVSLGALLEGIRFVRQRQVILGAMTLDMFAVIFGGAVALLPVYAEKILDVGPAGYGALAASLDVGALGMSVALVLLPPIRRMGKALIVAVLFYGIGVIAFGASSYFPLSMAAYAFIGMSDQVSVVCRQTMVQLATPDELRGRVTSVNMLFIGASNRLGAVESGVVASLFGPVFAVVSGGVGCIVVLAIVAIFMPKLRNFEIGQAIEHDPPAKGGAASTPAAAG
ncbi:MAG: MFS transporter [Dehalococcoidia bacterium]|nr:MFS transporter [Dehalococcoidia bacterium]MCB9485598.1 MFS transporter [Thermoflexaceae bacterium]